MAFAAVRLGFVGLCTLLAADPETAWTWRWSDRNCKTANTASSFMLAMPARLHADLLLVLV